MNIEKTIMELEKHHMQVYFVANAAEAKEKVLSLIPAGATVANGGSMTLVDSGILDAVKSGEYRYLDRNMQGLSEDEKNMRLGKIMTCDYFLSSSNAITENGELYNVDGTSNRVNALLYGPKNVIIVAGINKIVPDLEAAVRRVKEIAAPKNCKRLNCNTYCFHKGHCVSLDRGGDMADGCDSDARICCNYTVMASQRLHDRVKVILVNEELGY